MFPQIKLNGGGDLCQPTLNGNQLVHKNAANLNTQFFNRFNF